MKKIIRLIFVLAMLFAFMTPVMAVDFHGDQTISEPRTCNGIDVSDNASLKIDSSVEISGSPLFILGRNSTLTIGSNGFLTGNDIMFGSSGSARIFMEDGGAINISFYDSFCADDFAAFLEENGINCRHVNNSVIAPCPHASTSPVSAYVCDDCGEIVAVDTYTASVLSEGSLTIVIGVAAAVVFGLGGFLLGRRKKPALANGANSEDEE